MTIEGKQMLTIFLAACVGLGLAAATGFRVFLPLFGMSLAAKFLGFHLNAGLTWLTNPEAIITLGIATIAEAGAYYIPWVDNLLDTIATPAAAVAGTLAAGAVIVGVDDPVVKWGLAAIAGGGVSSMVQVGTVATRAASTATTGGIANPVVATGEWMSALLLTGLSIFAPVLVIAALLFLVWGIWKVIRYFRLRKTRENQNAQIINIE
jgi:hypothetical protein